MTDTGDRAVSAVYITDPALIRPWSMALDSLPNQGQLDTAVPAHAVDLDAIRRAAAPEWGDEEWAVAPEHTRPRVVTHRRRRAWSWWEVLALVSLVVLIVALVIDPMRTLLHLFAGALIASAVAGPVMWARRLRAGGV